MLSLDNLRGIFAAVPIAMRPDGSVIEEDYRADIRTVCSSGSALREKAHCETTDTPTPDGTKARPRLRASFDVNASFVRRIARCPMKTFSIFGR